MPGADVDLAPAGAGRLRVAAPSRAGVLTLSLFVLLMGSLAFALSSLVTDSFRTLEDREAGDQAERVRQAIDAELRALDDLVSGWVVRDDIHRLLAERNPALLASIAADSTLRAKRLDVLLFVDRDGRLVWGRDLDRATGEGREVGRGVVEAFAGAPRVMRHSSESSSALGVVLVREQPVLVASRPSLESDGTGPSTGTVVVARRLDAATSKRISRTTNVEFEVHPLDAVEPEDVLRAKGALFQGAAHHVEPVDDQYVGGTILLRTLDGDPAVFLRALTSREVFRHGMRSRLYVLLSIAGLGVPFLVVSLTLLKRLTRTRSARDELERMTRAVVEQSNDGVVLLDARRGRVVQANESARRLLAMPPDADWTSWVEVLLGSGLQAADVDRAGDPFDREIRRHGADGRVRDLEVTARRVSSGERTLVHVSVRDVTDRRRTEAQMRHHAYHDPLTQLPNRLLFHEHVVSALARSERSRENVGVFVIDLDHFKAVNDTLGHDLGDRLLVQVARRLSASVRAGDIVARQGGDEFMVLAPRVDHPEAAAALADRLLSALRTPFELDGREIHVYASVGIALFPTDGYDAGTLYRNADVAMYHAKQSGRNQWQIHDPKMNERAADALDLRTDLVRAVERGELSVRYQPQVDARTGRVVALEALVRWNSPTRGPVEPSRFLPVAEETGLVVPIGEWVLAEVCRQQQAWRRAGLPAVRLGVNLSPRQLLQSDLLERVRTIVASSGADPRAIEFEVTESVAIRNATVAESVLRALKRVGFSIALDDFGTGYSALAYLRQFPFDRLKIDRAFLKDIGHAEGDRSIVESIVGLAHSLDLEVVAEGVESAEHVEALRSLGCDLLQGFFLARPTTAEDAARLVAAGRVDLGAAAGAERVAAGSPRGAAD